VPTINLVVGMLDKSHKGRTIALAISFSMIGSPYAIESLRGTRKQVHHLQGSGVTSEGWIV
jgi:hypothetical protein